MATPRPMTMPCNITGINYDHGFITKLADNAPALAGAFNLPRCGQLWDLYYKDPRTRPILESWLEERQHVKPGKGTSITYIILRDLASTLALRGIITSETHPAYTRSSALATYPSMAALVTLWYIARLVRAKPDLFPRSQIVPTFLLDTYDLFHAWKLLVFFWRRKRKQSLSGKNRDTPALRPVFHIGGLFVTPEDGDEDNEPERGMTRQEDHISETTEEALGPLGDWVSTVPPLDNDASSADSSSASAHTEPTSTALREGSPVPQPELVYPDNPTPEPELAPTVEPPSEVTSAALTEPHLTVDPEVVADTTHNTEALVSSVAEISVAKSTPDPPSEQIPESTDIAEPLPDITQTSAAEPIAAATEENLTAASSDKRPREEHEHHENDDEHLVKKARSC